MAIGEPREPDRRWVTIEALLHDSITDGEDGGIRRALFGIDDDVAASVKGEAGVSREDAYAAVQENAMKVWRGEGRFLDFLKADARVTLPASQLEALFDLGYHTKHVDTVFARVFGAA